MKSVSASGLVLLALGLCGDWAPAAQNALVKYPDYPAAIERDTAYQVRVRQGESRRALVIYNHCEKSVLADRTRGGDVNRRFCEFAFRAIPSPSTSPIIPSSADTAANVKTHINVMQKASTSGKYRRI